MDIKIANRVLIKLGEEPIGSLNETPFGPTMEYVYDDLRRSLLSMYPWRFAIETRDLAPIEEDTKNGYNKFLLPSDCLLFLGVGEMYKPDDLRDIKMTSGELYQIRGSEIYSRFNPLHVRYVKDVKQEEKFSSLFREALICKIASELTTKIHLNPQLRSMFEQEFSQRVSEAMQYNEIIQDTQQLRDNSWVSIREGWNNGD
jgi:hypothetical protein